MDAGSARVSPFMVPMMSPSMAAAQISIQNGIRGPVITCVAACASGVQAFIEAQRLIERGDVDVVIAGGTESAILPVSFAALANMGALSKRNDDPDGASRPFDADRDGFVFGEAAGVLVVEAAEHAEARGASIVAEVAGGALTGDAFHISAPDPSGYGATLAMQRAVRDAQLEMEPVQSRRGPRHLDAAERRDRDEGDPRRVRRPRRSAGGEQQQEHGRPHARRGRRGVRPRRRARHPRRRHPAHDQLRRRPTPPATSTTCRTRRAARPSTSRSPTDSASAARTPSPSSPATPAEPKPTAARTGPDRTFDPGGNRAPRGLASRR